MRLQSPTREVCWLQSSSVHPNDEDQENAWSQTQQLLHQNDELGQNCVSGHKLLKQTLLNTCATCVLLDGP